jgi:hypothetical protein
VTRGRKEKNNLAFLRDAGTPTTTSGFCRDYREHSEGKKGTEGTKRDRRTIQAIPQPLLTFATLNLLPLPLTIDTSCSARRRHGSVGRSLNELRPKRPVDGGILRRSRRTGGRLFVHPPQRRPCVRAVETRGRLIAAPERTLSSTPLSAREGSGRSKTATLEFERELGEELLVGEVLNRLAPNRRARTTDSAAGVSRTRRVEFEILHARMERRREEGRLVAAGLSGRLVSVAGDGSGVGLTGVLSDVGTRIARF